MHQMSEASRRSRVTITLGRSGQVVNRDGGELDAGYELPRAGTKRSVKERLGNQLDSSSYGSDVISKRQRGEASFSGNDLQIGQNDLRFKLMQKNAQRRAQSDECGTMDLRAKLSRSEQPPRTVEPSDGLLPPSRTARGSSQISSCSYSPWALDDIRQTSPERFMGTSRGLLPPRNAGSIIGISRAPSPPRNVGRIMGIPRALSPPRNARRLISTPRALSPPRTVGRIFGTPRDLSPPRNTRNFSGGYRDLSPTRNVGSYSRRFSPPRNPGSYMGSSRGSPPSRNIDDFHGRRMMLDDVRAPSYTVRGVLNGQAPASRASFSRPMLPPPVPNPHPLPPLSQFSPLVEEPLTVDSFLNSIGLGKYSLAFKREEVDMSTIKQMKESDLKDLIIPMGPRKKILQAIASLPKR